MKTISLKLILLSITIWVATAAHSQNNLRGTIRDTATTYKENPEDHAHVQTTVISTEAKTENDNNTNMSSPAPDENGVANNTQPATDATDAVVPGEANTNTCSCTSLYIAYGAATVGILGMLLFLALYLNERNRDKRNA